MSDLETAIVTGVISGVVTSAFLWVVKIVLERVFIPWYREMKYEGVNVEGQWTTQIEDSGRLFTINIDLKQSAHALSGSAYVKVSDSAGGPAYIFDLTGHMREGYMTLSCKSAARRQVALLTLLLRLCRNGESLSGNMSGIAYEDGSIHSTTVEFERQNSIEKQRLRSND